MCHAPAVRSREVSDLRFSRLLWYELLRLPCARQELTHVLLTRTTFDFAHARDSEEAQLGLTAGVWRMGSVKIRGHLAFATRDEAAQTSKESTRRDERSHDACAISNRKC